MCRSIQQLLHTSALAPRGSPFTISGAMWVSEPFRSVLDYKENKDLRHESESITRLLDMITATGQDLPLHPLRLCPWLSSLSACPKSHRKVSLPSSDSSTLSAVGNKQSQWSTAVILTLLRELSGILTMTCTHQFIDDIIRKRAAARTEISLTTKNICQWQNSCSECAV